MRKALSTILAYVLWLASAALSLWVLMIGRIFLFIDLPGDVLRVNPWTLPAIDKFGTLILAVFWLIFVVVTEPYFRKLQAEDFPVGKILRIFAIEALLLGLMYGGTILA